MLEDNIKIDLTVIISGDMDGIYLAQGTDHWRALMNTVMNHRIS
jgi:hypothetical protein